MPLNAEGCLVDQTPQTPQSVDVISHAPPLYGQHILDQLYADMEQPDLMTPAPQSGMNTPFYTHSQTGSSDNIASLNQAIDSTGAVTPAALSSRLQNLDITSRNSSFTRLQAGMGSGANTPHHEAAFSSSPRPGAAHGSYFGERTSDEDDRHGFFSTLTSGQHTPEHIDYSDLGDLSKVPSYSTAVRAPLPSATSPAGLPNYETALSTPRSAPASPALLSGSPISPGGSSLDGNRRNIPHSHGTDIEETRRLHLLRRDDTS